MKTAKRGDCGEASLIQKIVDLSMENICTSSMDPYDRISPGAQSNYVLRPSSNRRLQGYGIRVSVTSIAGSRSHLGADRLTLFEFTLSKRFLSQWVACSGCIDCSDVIYRQDYPSPKLFLKTLVGAYSGCKRGHDKMEAFRVQGRNLKGTW